MGNWNSFWTEINKHGSPFHGRPHKRLLNRNSQPHKQLSCTWNANRKWSTGQSGLRNNPQTSHQINCCKHKCTTAKNANSQFASFRFHKQTAQTSCFTFQNNNFNSKNSSKLLCSTKTQPSLSSLASSQTISSNLTGSKNQLELSHRISL